MHSVHPPPFLLGPPFCWWGSQKPIYRGNSLKRGAWTVCRFKGRLDNKRGVVFLRGGWCPNCTLWYGLQSSWFNSQLVLATLTTPLGSWWSSGWNQKKKETEINFGWVRLKHQQWHNVGHEAAKPESRITTCIYDFLNFSIVDLSGEILQEEMHSTRWCGFKYPLGIVFKFCC